jgi:Tfp pilus assembly protein PilF
MSLLIKALDQAAKRKAVDEKNKAKNSLEQDPLSLELESVIRNNSERYVHSLAEEAGITMLHSNTKVTRQKQRSSITALDSDDESDSLSDDAIKKQPNISAHLSQDENLSDNAQRTNQNQTTKPLKKNKLPPIFNDIEAQNAEHQKAAASVFKANDEPKRQSSWLALVLLSIAGALTIWLLWQGYLTIKSWLAPEVVIFTPSPVSNISPINSTDFNTVDRDVDIGGDALDKALVLSDISQMDDTAPALTNPKDFITDSKNSQVGQLNAEPQAQINTASVNRDDVIKDAVQNMNQVRNAPIASDEGNSKNTHLTLTRRTPADAVEPAVLAAYNAFQRGDYATSQQQYRIALQQDARNIDALLGMAAVAQRQNRLADANGWYQKVLEVAPRNTIALTAIANLQVNQDAVASESRLKSLIAQQPSAAHLHAALGHLYATKQQWSDAQDAYFNASRLSPNLAEYAFNVAVSLEHLNKPQLALVQYERTLSLINSTDAISPSRQIVEARIQALQQ